MTGGGGRVGPGTRESVRIITAMVIKVELPDDALRAAGLTGQDADRQARFLLLLELYREGKLSLGRLGELVDCPQAELLERMKSHGTYLNYSLADLAADRQALS
jgi:predicted HTH domain antitoxin